MATRCLHKAAQTLQLGPTHIGGSGQHAGFFVSPNEDVTAFAQLALLVLARAVGRDAAVHRDAATIGQQMHRTGLRAAGVDVARMQNAGHRLAQRCSLHVDLPAFGHDHAVLGVGHRRVDAGGCQLQFDLAGAAHRHRDRFCRTQSHATLGRDDLAFVADAGAQQGHVAAGGHFDAPLVDDLARAVAPCVALFAGHEVSVRDVERGRREGAGAHAAVAAHHNALGVDQHHLAVGLQLTQDVGGVV